jgi:DNA modification methylase
MAEENGKPKRRKKDSAHLRWDSKPKRAPNSKDIEFQTAEIVIPNPARDEKSLPFGQGFDLAGASEIDKARMNRLIWGDNLLAMQALIAQGYEGAVDLIYIDPPFHSGADYSHRMTIEGQDVTKTPSVIERLAYTDTWAGGVDSYLDMLYPRLHLMKKLLKDTGSIYVHLDWHVGHYVKVLMDEIFGPENFRNEIVWRNTSSHGNARRYGNIHQVIYFYSRNSEKYYWNEQYRVPYDDYYIETYFKYIDEAGRKFKSEDLTVPSRTESNYFEWLGKYPSGKRGWGYPLQELERLKEKGRIFITKKGFPRYKRFLDEMEGMPPQSLWIDKGVWTVGSWSDEGVEYETQKPEALLERIIKASTLNPSAVERERRTSPCGRFFLRFRHDAPRRRAPWTPLDWLRFRQGRHTGNARHAGGAGRQALPAGEHRQLPARDDLSLGAHHPRNPERGAQALRRGAPRGFKGIWHQGKNSYFRGLARQAHDGKEGGGAGEGSRHIGRQRLRGTRGAGMGLRIQL